MMYMYMHFSYSRSGSPYSDSRSGSDYSDDEGGRSPSNREEGGGTGGRGKKGGDQFELFEPFSPVNSPDHLFDLSDEELGTSKQVWFKYHTQWSFFPRLLPVIFYLVC